MFESGVLFTFMFFALLFGLFMIVLSAITAPKAGNEQKSSQYECGIDVKTDARIQYHMQFFVYAILFLIFDVETIFIFPFALSFNFLGSFVVIEILIFIALLLLGLVYAIRTRMLRFR